MYCSIVISFGVVSDITTSYSHRTEKNTLKVVLNFPKQHYSNSEDFFYSYDMTIQDRFCIGDKVLLYALRHPFKGNFIKYMVSAEKHSFFSDYILKNFIHRVVKTLNGTDDLII